METYNDLALPIATASLFMINFCEKFYTFDSLGIKEFLALNYSISNFILIYVVAFLTKIKRDIV